MKLKELRAAKGWTQRELAAESGVTRANIARIETNRVTPELLTLTRLADALGCSIDEIVGREVAREAWSDD